MLFPLQAEGVSPTQKSKTQTLQNLELLEYKQYVIGCSHSTDPLIIPSEVAFRPRGYHVHETERNLVFRLESHAQINYGTCGDSNI